MKKLSITWMLVAAISCNHAHADTYNFIFEKPKNAGAAPLKSEGTPASKASEATNAASAPAPTIINNNVSVPQIDSAPNIGGPASDASTSVTVSAPPDLSNRSRYWTLGLSTGGVGVPAIYPSSSGSSSSSTYTSQRESIFVQLQIGYRIARYLNSNTMVSIGVDKRAKAAFIGSDLEWLPIRINVGSFDLFELGPLAGFSTAAAAPGNWGSFHIGARSNINIGSQFGITGAARVNKAYWMADFGVKFKI